MPYYGKGVVGVDTLRRTTFKEFDLAVTEKMNADMEAAYGVASGTISAGACGLDAAGTIAAGTGYIADAAFASGEYGFVRKADTDQVVIPFYGMSANGGDAAVIRIVAPFAFTLKRIDTVLLGGALATANFTLTAAIAGVGVTDGVVTVTQSGSAAGDKDSATPSALNTGAQGATITLTGGGTSTGNRTINGFVTLERA